ncbi:ABC transporter permease [Streptomyces sp. NPDC058045]|uniref:ABC transporter permease n=1 Tax=Streptomyces sp. NPDC058045 TaxID=3346311 RepID=UPI0036E22A9A
MSSADSPLSLGPAVRRRGRPFALRRAVAPWLLILPAVLWLLAFLAVPLAYVLRMSFSTDTLSVTATGWALDAYRDAVGSHLVNLENSLLIGALATVIAFLVGVPVAYGISFFGGRWRSALVFLAAAPFLTSYLIRVISWQTLLGANGPLLALLRGLGLVPERFAVLGTPFAVVAGLAYQLIPFVLLPMYAAFNRVDRGLCDAADDLYSTRCGATGAWIGGGAGLVLGAVAAFTLAGRSFQPALPAVVLILGTGVVAAVVGASMTERFVHVVLPLSRSGLVASVVLTFIPAMGDYVNAAMLGNVHTQMMGNIIQTKYLVEMDYAGAAAVSSLLLAITLAVLGLYLRSARGTEVLDVV